jgi:hypothetical protein
MHAHEVHACEMRTYEMMNRKFLICPKVVFSPPKTSSLIALPGYMNQDCYSGNSLGLWFIAA